MCPKPPLPRCDSSRPPSPTSCEGGLLDLDDDELGDPVAPADGVVVLGIVVDEDDLELAPVPRVDQARGVETGQAVAGGQPAPGQDQAGVPGRDGDGHPGRDHGPAAPAAQHGVGAGDQVGAGVALAGVGGRGQLGVELLQGDGQHRRTLQGPGQPPSSEADR